jgi:hypothetical protein
MDGRIKLEYLNQAMKTKVRRRRASLRKQKYRDGLQTIRNQSKENRDYRNPKYLAWCRRGYSPNYYTRVFQRLI